MWSRRQEERLYRRLSLIPMVVGVGLLILGAIHNSAWEVVLGLFAVCIGAFGPRLKGQFEITFGGGLRIRGELTVEPDGDDDQPPLPPAEGPPQLPKGPD